MTLTLLLNAGLNVAAAALFAYSGALTLRRSVDDEARPAQRLFALWWFSVAAVMVLAGSPTLLWAIGIASVGLQVAISYLTAFPLAIALWSLLCYLIFIYTGRRKAWWWLALAYVAFVAFELYYFSSFGERSLQETTWGVRLVGSQEPAAWITVTFGLLLAVPILAVLASYAALYFRTDDRGAKRRIAMVSGGFALWFGVVLVAFLLGWDRADWFPLTYEAPGVVAAAMVATAYRPANRA